MAAKDGSCQPLGRVEHPLGSRRCCGRHVLSTVCLYIRKQRSRQTRRGVSLPAVHVGRTDWCQPESLPLMGNLTVTDGMTADALHEGQSAAPRLRRCMLRSIPVRARGWPCLSPGAVPPPPPEPASKAASVSACTSQAGTVHHQLSSCAEFRSNQLIPLLPSKDCKRHRAQHATAFSPPVPHAHKDVAQHCLPH